MTRAYYSEINPHAAQWLRNLIDMGMIANGDVDERDMRDVTPNDLAGYTQCHFFAGIGVWSYALRMAGWPDDRPVWTASPPCQPFSAAGRGGGVADERHLFPHLYHLIRVRRPPNFFGEQVASKDGLDWLDLVQADMEAEDYSGGAFDLCAAGVGAPHIRQRLSLVFRDGRIAWPSHAEIERRNEGYIDRLPGRPPIELGRYYSPIQLEHCVGEGLEGQRRDVPHRDQSRRDDEDASGSIAAAGAIDQLAHSAVGGWLSRTRLCNTEPNEQRGIESTNLLLLGEMGIARRPGPVNSGWANADWLFCRDGRWRPVESGTFPLVDGSAFRMDSGGPFAGKSRGKMLEGAGNAIVSEQQAHVIAAYLEHEADEIAAFHAAGSGLHLIGDLL